MAENAALSVPDSLMDQIHCSLCKGYLSCAPVRVLPDGTCICGQCSPPSNDVAIYRVLTLEAILKSISFPCRFKQHGCVASLPFGQAAEHESKCAHRLFACPVPSAEACLWKGLGSQMLDHFSDKHTEVVTEDADFKIHVNQNAQGTYVVVRDQVPFVVKYLYSSSERNLKYDIRYFANPSVDTTSYRIQLNSATDCNVGLKTNPCFPYDKSMGDLRNTLSVDKYLEILDDPDCFTVGIDLKVVKSVPAAVNESLVNYDKLKSLRCKGCNNYLIPPLFNLDGKTICCDCAKSRPNLSESTDEELQRLVDDANYPCRWQDCSFVAKSDRIRMHEVSCRFRRYRCCYSDCPVIYQLTSATDHLQSHSVQYLPSGSYNFTFSKQYGSEYAFKIENNTVIVFKHSVLYFKPIGWYHQIILLSDSLELTAIVHFEHQHCKLQSEQFILISNVSKCIYQVQLPSCFTHNEELTVTISNCHWSAVRET